MPILRTGIDKITLTVRTGDMQEWPYPKRVAEFYKTQLKRLKFSDRYAMVIEFNSYPHDKKRDDPSSWTWGLTYFLRLDGMRQMRVLMNCQRIYNIINQLPMYDKRLHDDNVVIPSHQFSLTEFVDLVKRELETLKRNYVKIRKEVFGQSIDPNDVIIDTHQAEIITEGIGMHTNDVSQTFKDYARCDSMKVYHNQTQTMYFNSSDKHQLKIYQKGVGILRLEATLNQRVDDIVLGWKEDSWMITESIEQELTTLLNRMGVPRDWWEKRRMSKDSLLWTLADALGLEDEQGNVDAQLMNVLVTSDSFQSKYETRNLVRRLRRKKLLKPLYRGIYVPTERLRLIQELVRKLDAMKELWI